MSAIDAANPQFNAYVAVTHDKAREMAKASDARRAAGKAGPLEGIPLGIKDLFGTEGVHTQAASHILDGFKPRYESTVTANLWADGAVMLGKLNMDEFAMGSSNETSYYGPVVNPWRARGSNAKLVPGRLVGRLGGGRRGASVRRRDRDRHRRLDPPAGRLHRHGRHQADLWPLLALGHRRLRLLARPGRPDRPRRARRRDPAAAPWRASIRRTRPRSTARCRTTRRRSASRVKGLKIGIPREYRIDGMPAEIEALWQKGIAWLNATPAREIVDISLPHTKYALPAYYIVAPAEASSNLARYDGVRYGLRVHGQDIIDMYEKTRAAGFGARGQAPHHDRHLRALGRLLRRLLPAGAEGAHADQARFRDGLRRRCRRDPDAGDARRPPSASATRT